jgi:hypothetical protein
MHGNDRSPTWGMADVNDVYQFNKFRAGVDDNHACVCLYPSAYTKLPLTGTACCLRVQMLTYR